LYVCEYVCIYVYMYRCMKILYEGDDNEVDNLNYEGYDVLVVIHKDDGFKMKIITMMFVDW
jgi:hypothetical protein